MAVQLRSPSNLTELERICMEENPQIQTESGKLSPRYIGPYEIDWVIDTCVASVHKPSKSSSLAPSTHPDHRQSSCLYKTAGGDAPRERRVPPAGAVAEVIREKGPTRVQSRRRRPPYPVPSNRSLPSAPLTDTAPRHKRKEKGPLHQRRREATQDEDPPPHKKKRRGVPHIEPPAAWRGGRLLPQPRHLPSDPGTLWPHHGLRLWITHQRSQWLIQYGGLYIVRADCSGNGGSCWHHIMVVDHDRGRRMMMDPNKRQWTMTVDYSGSDLDGGS
ncbi:unnamed protein product [Pleuronectes platessa]|uniref:Uncharacterized protein n=1 Tax=Pleuronectes platessa TaxID=8262 RepID=A0A9N7U0B6_PLEPL|nr:unnamed protein product [Pleuronectes platessa]